MTKPTPTPPPPEKDLSMSNKPPKYVLEVTIKRRSARRWRREYVALGIYAVGFTTAFTCYEFGLIEWSLFTSVTTLVGVFAVIWRYR